MAPPRDADEALSSDRDGRTKAEDDDAVASVSVTVVVEFPCRCGRLLDGVGERRSRSLRADVLVDPCTVFFFCCHSGSFPFDWVRVVSVERCASVRAAGAMGVTVVEEGG